LTGTHSSNRRVTIEAPVRVCDVGGWTDTWFAGHGRVCNLAVGPGVRVTGSAVAGEGRVTITVAADGTSFVVGAEPAQHRLLAEAVGEAGPSPDVDVHLEISATVPPASSLGTSAAVTVAVIAACDAMADRHRTAAALAVAAHRVETERLGRQSGIQDQIASAHGGASAIDMPRYPEAVVRPLFPDDEAWAALDRGLVHIPYGSGHDSSAVHEAVIAELTEEGPSSIRLQQLRELAADAEDALVAGDLHRYGSVLTAATDAQAELHRSLVSPDAWELIDLARACGALGWKVNGAGGASGSISILCRPSDRALLVDAVTGAGHAPLGLRLARDGARAV
jgi:D-glycero-alpha-D-manno-heptose-7-phosphate kinase